MEKTIIRVSKSKSNPYVMINKALLQNPELSAKEKGILAYLLSLPDNWVIHVGELVNHFTDGRDSIYSGFASLIGKGFIQRFIVRQPTGQIIRYEYVVFESQEDAQEALETTVYGKPGNGFSAPTNNEVTKHKIPNHEGKVSGLTRYDYDKLFRADFDRLERECQCNPQSQPTNNPFRQSQSETDS